MVGVDFHDGFPFDAPMVDIPFVPHLVIAVVRWGIWIDAFESEHPSVVMSHGHAMSKIFDIGSCIPQVTVPALNGLLHMALWTLLSASEGHFGVASVLVEGEPLAVALNYDENPQLNCGDPLSLPTGTLIVPNTVVAGMTIGDLVAGQDSMFMHSLVGAAVSKLGEKWLGKVISDEAMDSLIGRFIIDTKITGPIEDLINENIVDKVAEWDGEIVDRISVTSEYFDNPMLMPVYM